MPLERRWRFAGIGALLGLGSPAGLLGLRALISRDASLEFVSAQLGADPWLYAYLATGSVLALGTFGFALGSQVDRLDQAALTDPLTGLGNRRRFQERLALECARAARYGDPLSLLLVDVDLLKQVNDRGGHAAGDTVLRQVAAVIATDLRRVDLGARWGGDEFAVLAPRADASEALALAERIRQEVERTAGSSVSIGVTSSLRGAPDAEALLRAADVALYSAKQAGRNRVCLTALDAADGNAPALAS